MNGSSWIFPDGANRERMVELDEQLRPVRRAVLVVLGLCLVGSGPWLGWWTLAPLVAAAAGFGIADSRVSSMRRPEYALLAAWVASEVIMAISVALSGGPTVPMTAWLAIPVLTLGARFSNRGIAFGVVVAIGLLFAVEFGVDAKAVLHDPPLLIGPLALIVCVALFQTVLMRSELRLRSEVVVDSMTGMFNRKALERRVDELEQQAFLTGQPVAVIVGDIDRFKQINDSFGHAVGDALLVDVGYALRKTLRAYDLCFRTGGEEFVVLLPGADIDRAVELAEQLRLAVSALSRETRPLTMSFGVAASPTGPFDYVSVFARADTALYEAKRSGRNRVCVENRPAARPAVSSPHRARELRPTLS
jgi:diguanylate cyclase (GGDEF)-like protein